MKKNEPGPFSYTIHKNKFKMDETLNVRQEAFKILEEKAGKNLFDFGHSNSLLNMSLEAREAKAKMNYWDLIKIKSFCTAKKETISKTERKLMEWEKIFANHISDKGLVSKIYKVIKLNTEKQINSVKKWTENMNIFSKEDIQMANRHIKRCSTSVIIREMQIETTEISPHTCQNGSTQQHKKHVLARMWREENPLTLLVGM